MDRRSEGGCRRHVREPTHVGFFLGTWKGLNLLNEVSRVLLAVLAFATIIVAPSTGRPDASPSPASTTGQVTGNGAPIQTSAPASTTFPNGQVVTLYNGCAVNQLCASIVSGPDELDVYNEIAQSSTDRAGMMSSTLSVMGLRAVHLHNGVIVDQAPEVATAQHDNAPTYDLPLKHAGVKVRFVGNGYGTVAVSIVQ